MTDKKRARRSKELSRQKILEESLAIIAERGWSGLTLQNVAKACGMSASNLTYHFERKELLLLSLLDQISQNNWRIVADGMKPELNAHQRLVVHFQKNLEWAQLFPSEAQVIVQIYAEAGHDSEFAPVFAVMFDRAQGRVLEYLLAGQREGLFRFQVQPALLARLIHNMLVGAFINTIGMKHTTPVEYRLADLEKVLQSLVGLQKSF